MEPHDDQPPEHRSERERRPSHYQDEASRAIRNFSVIGLGYDPERDEPWPKDVLEWARERKSYRERQHRRLGTIVTGVLAALGTGAVGALGIPWLKALVPGLFP